MTGWTGYKIEEQFHLPAVLIDCCDGRSRTSKSKRFFWGGPSANAVKTQIWTALIAMLLPDTRGLFMAIFVLP